MTEPKPATAKKRTPPADRSTRLVLIWTMAVGCGLAGVAFAYKVATFIFTLTTPDFAGTFDVGILVYFCVSAGWMCVLVWCFLSGKFKQMEQGKYELLRQEEEYERLGI